MTAPSSPCIGVCEIDPQNGFCLGCFRSLDEIAAWPGLQKIEQQDMLTALAQRKALLLES